MIKKYDKIQENIDNFGLIFLQPLENLRLIMAWFLTTSVWVYSSITSGLAQASSYTFGDYGKNHTTTLDLWFRRRMVTEKRSLDSL